MAAAFSFFFISLAIKELGWASGIGLNWPLFIAYLLEGRVQFRPKRNPSKGSYESLDFNFADCCRPVRFGVLLLPPIPDVGQSVFLASP